MRGCILGLFAICTMLLDNYCVAPATLSQRVGAGDQRDVSGNDIFAWRLNWAIRTAKVKLIKPICSGRKLVLCPSLVLVLAVWTLAPVQLTTVANSSGRKSLVVTITSLRRDTRHKWSGGKPSRFGNSRSVRNVLLFDSTILQRSKLLCLKTIAMHIVHQNC